MELEVSTTSRVDVVGVTDEVADAVPNDVEEGVCHVFVRHTTAGVVVNENERRLLGDLERKLAELVPRGDSYEHDALDGNADAHLRSVLLGESVSVPVRDGQLSLGTWQSILLVEGDGPRTRRLTVTVVE